MNTFTTDVAKRETLATMIGTYQQGIKRVEEAYATLETAQTSLRAVFLDAPGYTFSVNDRQCTEVGKKASDEIRCVGSHSRAYGTEALAVHS